VTARRQLAGGVGFADRALSVLAVKRAFEVKAARAGDLDLGIDGQAAVGDRIAVTAGR
jgi:hypothetical protein